ncbi:hypothetical protein [Dyadobacter diqingensis]|uniref:hypothetical protein n=1 Tax=Dyadobacter diqingensis TaxID=2938121 RepID=UPI0020C1B371|nr:hypothetical protein [Dyadobacter diqingensis]
MTHQAYTKTLFPAMFAAVMLFSSSSLFAQVKIGTNPTTINPANNLEVEASTTGRKTSVNKTTGQVTVKDGTEGTDKVFTSDANGGASWQTKELPKGKLIGGVTTWLVPGIDTDVTFPSLQYSVGGITKVGNGIRVSVSGYYLVQSTAVIRSATGNPGVTACNGTSTAATYINLLVDGTAYFAANDKVSARWDSNTTLVISTLAYINANSVFTLQVRNNVYNNSDGLCGTYLADANISLTLQP